MKSVLPIRLRALVGALLLFPVASSANAGTCLSVDLMNVSGWVVTSPYGVDRTGHSGASAGYHQGLDMVNGEGAGTPIYSGSGGTVRYRTFTGGADASGLVAEVTVPSGDTMFRYLHMRNHATNGETREIAAGTQVGTMGCAGMKSCSPHLHLYAMLRGSELAASGYAGRMWHDFAGKHAAPMTSEAIRSAAPRDWYYVNPETFLSRRIPIVHTYPDMPGGVHTTTLPQSCTADSSSAVTVNPQSAGETRSRESAVAGDATIAGTEDYAFKSAEQPIRSLWISLAKQSATSLVAGTLDHQSALDASLAELVLVTALPSSASAP
ncbi:peptidoglycan DD-metalloendopeptidase family protein [Pinisolibacter sp. B13]|nr:peptidoglycan DD-metalloendopeptidase family protein [Pinisolibacter aquiterrae]